MSWAEATTLTGKHVILRPYTPEDAEALFQTLSPNLLQFFTVVYDFEYPPFVQWLAAQSKIRSMFVQTLAGSGEVVGLTTFLDIQPQNQTLEIGGTWLAKEQHGTRINPEAKCLLLQYAFENLRAVRVQIKTDSRNVQSQRAIEKLGAVKEGVLRNHMLMADGRLRHTVMYSILPEEWHTKVKPTLQARLEAEG